MQVTETLNDGLKREYKITVPAADIEARITNRLTEIAKGARVPGFRPGKVPVNLLRKTHGKSVMGEVLQQTLNESTQSTMSERGLRPVSQPKVEIDTFEEGQDLEYTVALELFPEIALVDFADIELERLEVAPDEEQVTEAMENMARNFSETKAVEKKRKLMEGDIAVIDFVGTVDGEEFAGGKAENYNLELGTNTFVPGFEEQITGAEPGDHLDIKVTFPGEYAEELAGKDAVFAVDVKEIREAVPVPLDDDLAKKVGAENIEELRQRLRDEHKGETASIARMRLKKDLLDKLEVTHDFALPAGMVGEEFESIWGHFQHQREHHPDQIDEDDQEKSDEELKTQYEKIAQRRVRLGLLLADIGNKNNIQVTQEELNQAMMAEVRRYRGREQEMLDYYREHPEAMQALQGPLLEDKVIDFILELAKVQVREVSLEDLLNPPEDAEKPTEEGKKPKKRAKKAQAAKKGDEEKAAKPKRKRTKAKPKGAET